jgi:hypothetical protein
MNQNTTFLVRLKARHFEKKQAVCNLSKLTTIYSDIDIIRDSLRSMNYIRKGYECQSVTCNVSDFFKCK